MQKFSESMFNEVSVGSCGQCPLWDVRVLFKSDFYLFSWVFFGGGGSTVLINFIFQNGLYFLRIIN